MAQSLISLGANLGNPRQLMQLAGKMILDRFGTSNVTFSRLYRTPAVGGPTGQDDFYNAVAKIESSNTAFEIWRSLHEIEQLLGRRRRHRWEARRIDLDVLLHAGERHWTPTLKIPHPRMLMRTFVLEPACEIASDWIEPVTGQTIAGLSQMLQQSRANEQLGIAAIHILVLSESEQRIQRIAQSLIEPTHDSISNHDKATLVDSTKVRSTEDSKQTVVRMSRSRRITLQSVDPQSRTISQTLIEATRRQLNYQIVDYEKELPLQLLVFAGASPDPEAIHWEDYCRSWAELFELSPTNQDTNERNAFRRLPKYLLSADDPVWAAHELQAAMTAMTCPIEASGAFFDD